MSRKHQEYEVRQVADLLEVEARRVAGWAEQGLIAPTIASRGAGSRRRYLLKDVAACAVLLSLQYVLGERSKLARHVVGAIGAIGEVVAEQLATGKLDSHKQNALTAIVSWESGGEGVDLYFPWDAEAAAAVNNARANGDYIISAPLGRVLERVLERIEESEDKDT